MPKIGYTVSLLNKQPYDPKSHKVLPKELVRQQNTREGRTEAIGPRFHRGIRRGDPQVEPCRCVLPRADLLATYFLCV